MKVDKIVNGEARVIYKNHKPYGIRDNGGFLFFFAKIYKHSNQEERYKQEVEEQYRLADYLVQYLNSLVGEDGPTTERKWGEVIVNIPSHVKKQIAKQKWLSFWDDNFTKQWKVAEIHRDEFPDWLNKEE